MLSTQPHGLRWFRTGLADKPHVYVSGDGLRAYVLDTGDEGRGPVVRAVPPAEALELLRASEAVEPPDMPGRLSVHSGFRGGV